MQTGNGFKWKRIKKKMAEKIGKIWILSLKYNNLKETRSLSIIRYKRQKMSNSTIF